MLVLPVVGQVLCPLLCLSMHSSSRYKRTVGGHPKGRLYPIVASFGRI